MTKSKIERMPLQTRERRKERREGVEYHYVLKIVFERGEICALYTNENNCVIRKSQSEISRT